MTEDALEAPYIETDRLILRGLTRDDIVFLFDHFSRDEINEFSSSDNLSSLEEAEAFYERYIEPNPTRFRLGLVLKEDDRLIGTIGFHRYSRKDSRAEAGVDLAREAWGRGLMTEALGALISFGFEEMGLNRIEATTNPRNLRSIQLIERLGFVKEGVQRQKYFYNGKFQDDAMYSLLRKEWVGKLKSSRKFEGARL